MSEGLLFFFSKPVSYRPIEEKYVTEINGDRKSFIHEHDAMLYLFENGIRKFKRLTKEVDEYADITNLNTYEFWQMDHRIGYVLYGYEPYYDENGDVKKRRAYIWRFVGFGRSCFAPTIEELKDKVLKVIHNHKQDPEKRGFNKYPYYTKYYHI